MIGSDFHTNVKHQRPYRPHSFAAIIPASLFSAVLQSAIEAGHHCAVDPQSNLVMLARGKGQPDRVIQDILATLNQEKAKHDIVGLYNGRLRSHDENFEGLKRKWQGITGLPLPKKLRTSDPIESAIVAMERNPSKKEQCAMVEKVEAQNLKLITMMKTVVNQSSEVAFAQPMTTMPLHPDDKIDIDSMTVNELRKELRKRQLGTAGRKAELQARLREHLAEESKLREDVWTSKLSVVAASTHSDQIKVSYYSENRKNLNEMDIVMENADETTPNNKVVIDEPAKTNTSTANSKVIDPRAESDAMTKEVSKPTNRYVKQHAPKSALKPSKYSPSVIEKPSHHDDTKTVSREDSTSAAMPTKISDSSTNSINRPTIASDPSSKGTQKTKVPSSHAQKTPGGTSFKSAKAGGPGSAILFEKKIAHSAATEARKARLAEMRQKLVQPNAAIVGSSTELSSHSKKAVVSTLNKMPSSSALGESKSNSILTKMREKAAAEKNENLLNAPPTKSAGNLEHTSSMTSVNRVQLQTSSQPATAQGSMALKSILDPANKPIVIEPIKMPSPKKKGEKPLSPMQTYEMSDREEESDSESESDDDGNQRPKKVVPDWAQKPNLHQALERQFSDGPNRLDPDLIFGEVLTCNLEEIFDKKRSKYQRRTSSGNWTKDHVTLVEKQTYKRVMGYDQK